MMIWILCLWFFSLSLNSTLASLLGPISWIMATALMSWRSAYGYRALALLWPASLWLSGSPLSDISSLVIAGMILGLAAAATTTNQRSPADSANTTAVDLVNWLLAVAILGLLILEMVQWRSWYRATNGDLAWGRLGLAELSSSQVFFECRNLAIQAGIYRVIHQLSHSDRPWFKPSIPWLVAGWLAGLLWWLSHGADHSFGIFAWHLVAVGSLMRPKAEVAAITRYAGAGISALGLLVLIGLRASQPWQNPQMFADGWSPHQSLVLDLSEASPCTAITLQSRRLHGNEIHMATSCGGAVIHRTIALFDSAPWTICLCYSSPDPQCQVDFRASLGVIPGLSRDAYFDDDHHFFAMNVIHNGGAFSEEVDRFRQAQCQQYLALNPRPSSG